MTRKMRKFLARIERVKKPKYLVAAFLFALAVILVVFGILVYLNDAPNLIACFIIAAANFSVGLIFAHAKF